MQICDDKIFVFSNNIGPTNLPEARLAAWNWQTGQFLFVGLDGRGGKVQLIEPRPFLRFNARNAT
jgi:hypothetical protein